MTMKKNIPYKPFDTFVFRTPYFLLNSEMNGAGRKAFDEALLLASPDLYNEHKRLSTEIKTQKSTYKYLSRSRSRCTPFGLFAGCSVGKLGAITDIKFKEPKSYRRITRLDMNYLCALIQYIESLSVVRKQIKYFPNDSIYHLGGSIRYVEYFMSKTKRVHRISSIEILDQLTTILDTAKLGATIMTLAEGICDVDISYDEAEEFVYDIINAQLMKSELEVAVTGDDALSVLINKLIPLHSIDKIKAQLILIQSILKQIDAAPIGESQHLYPLIIDVIKEIGVSYDAKYVFQSDMYKPALGSTLSHEFVDELSNGLIFLNKLSSSQNIHNYNLVTFKDEFANTYGEAEVPICEVMDLDIGLGYPINSASKGDINSLIGDLLIPQPNVSQSQQISFDNVQKILFKRYQESYKNDNHEIKLEDSDFPDVHANWNLTMDTLNVFCNIISKDKDSPNTYIKNVGGSSSANLLGRFCHLDSDLKDLAIEITEKEQEFSPNVIIAEIAHLPQDRVGNIVHRPLLRKYEIPFLCQSGVDDKYKIPLSDITVSVRKNKIFLKSIKLNCEISPRLTTAHIYNRDTLPVYHFLGDLQTQGRQLSFGFHWGEWASSLEYRPRVVYRNLILSKERWIVSLKEIEKLKIKDETLLDAFNDYRELRNIPLRFVVSEYDNELLIDVENDLSLNVFLSLVAKRKTVSIDEFIFEGKTDVVSGYTNEFIIAFYRTDKQKR